METTRLLFTMGGMPFEDATFGFDKWGELKATMPYGQVPVLEVDGKVLAQSSAIERYAAKLTGVLIRYVKPVMLPCYCSQAH
ncbi:hypothetical protein DUNSADRAFT_15273 [Dunaliella salina]|uniref:GST N-terminal domain-containing protein n=1 Tax=Dunaliella salina TaxID=3046 RepID=A0ABQ7G5R0_DUNSA|nr:hypothetical protein DUNSADRAFT_15273 [Dunaliella salina]|eukprot:KAF5829954.1 hypothetical protein DUNSADRAFT_15273 [Dunaliella salina]